MTDANEIRDMPAPSIRKFNPGALQSDEEIRNQFVVRNNELNAVLEVLQGNIGSASCQHLLIVGPRGRGKTMLLARTASELRKTPTFAERLLPVQFTEESQEIFNLADFWLETLFHLARDSATQNPELSAQLRETHTELSLRWRDQQNESYARNAVLTAADQLDRRLVLMVENMQALGESVDQDFGWGLREVLQNEPQIMLLATATSRFESLDDAEQPFFELFRIINLEPLTNKQCRRLWQSISGDAVSGRDIRPLQILTGGSPRLLVIVAGFQKHRSLRHLMEELITLIDDHTEYFRSHLEVLGKTERRVYLALIDLWQPSKPGEIAARARMDVRVVSTMLGRLARRGAVLVEGSGKKRFYSAAERLYSIYYKLRRERNEAAIVENLIRFMAAFYNEAEKEEMFGTLLSEAQDHPAIREGVERANVGLFRLGGEDDKDVESRISHRLEAESAVALRLIRKGDDQVKRGDLRAAIATYDQVANRFGGSNNLALRHSTGVALTKKGDTQKELRNFKGAIEAYDKVVQRFSKTKEPRLQTCAALALSSKGDLHRQLGEYSEGIANYTKVVERFGDSDIPELQQVVTLSLIRIGNRQRKLGDFEAASKAYREVVQRFGASEAPEVRAGVAVAIAFRGLSYVQCGNWKAAIDVYSEAVERLDSQDTLETRIWTARAFEGIGHAWERLGDTNASLAAYDELLKRFGATEESQLKVHVARALIAKGNLHAIAGRATEALHTCELLEERLPSLNHKERETLSRQSKLVRTKALLMQKMHGEAMELLHSAYEMFAPDDEELLDVLLEFVPSVIAIGASPGEVAEILASDTAKRDVLNPLVVALRQIAGEEVRAPIEVLEVAADIRQRINDRVAKTATMTS